MVVPFQMVMFTLSKTADNLGLNTPWTIPIIYLGFGAIRNEQTLQSVPQHLILLETDDAPWQIAEHPLASAAERNLAEFLANR